MYNFSRALILRGDERTLPDEITLKTFALFDVQDVSFYDPEVDSLSKTPPGSEWIVVERWRSRYL
jgi:hypothetical protein